jgi:hypothetical protein
LIPAIIRLIVNCIPGWKKRAKSNNENINKQQQQHCRNFLFQLMMHLEGRENEKFAN